MGRNVTDVGLETTTKKELKKHAATIHCSNTLSLLQRKITNALLYHAYKELMLKEEHEITVKQLCRLIGYHGNNHAVIKEALKGLISTVIEWNVINDSTGEENWTASSIIASVSLEGPICYYAYLPRMKQLLHSPSMFGKIDLVIQSKFRSSYGLALYENCIRYRGLPQTKWFEIELFKKLMGVPPGKYEIFRDFKRRVLDKAIDEVNSYSDLIITSEFVREGRRVVKIRFTLKERAKKTRLGSRKRSVVLKLDPETTKKLEVQFRLSENQIEQLSQEYEASYISEKLTLIEDSAPYKTGKIQNLAGYLISALKFNYKFNELKAEETVIDLNEAKQILELDKIKRQIEDIRFAYNVYREKLINEAIANLEDEAKKNFMEAFIEFAQPTINMILQLQRHKYSHDNVFESLQLKAMLRRFARRELDLLNLIPPEEFIAQMNEDDRSAWQQLKSFDPDHPLLKFD